MWIWECFGLIARKTTELAVSDFHRDGPGLEPRLGRKFLVTKMPSTSVSSEEAIHLNILTKSRLLLARISYVIECFEWNTLGTNKKNKF